MAPTRDTGPVSRRAAPLVVRRGDRILRTQRRRRRRLVAWPWLLAGATIVAGGGLWLAARNDPGRLERLLGSDDAAVAAGGTATIAEIERLLGQLGFAPGPIDGTLDPATADAIRIYQSTAGLSVSGEPSATLLDELRQVADDLAAAPAD